MTASQTTLQVRLTWISATFPSFQRQSLLENHLTLGQGWQGTDAIVVKLMMNS
jgi:hypothetical protein